MSNIFNKIIFKSEECPDGENLCPICYKSFDFDNDKINYCEEGHQVHTACMKEYCNDESC